LINKLLQRISFLSWLLLLFQTPSKAEANKQDHIENFSAEELSEVAKLTTDLKDFEAADVEKYLIATSCLTK